MTTALSHFPFLQCLEWLAAAFTILGAALLASQGKRAGWGFVCFLVANTVWILFAWLSGLNGLLFQQLVLTVTSLIGIWNTLIVPDMPFVEEYLEG